MKERHEIKDAVLIGDWKEVSDLQTSAITHNEADTSKLNGLLLYGYETKFGKTNTNGERYTKECLDKFINEYFVANKLNMPVTIQHHDDLAHLCGRVIYCEVNTTGFYFVCYIPKALPNYTHIKALIEEGVLQGLSKEGWCMDGEWVYKKDGSFDYYRIDEMMLISVSLVACPANRVTFEKAAEIKNTLAFENKCGKKKKKDKSGTLSAMFSK